MTSELTRGTHLDDDLHQILLGDNVLAVDDLLQYRGEYVPLVHVQIDAIELGETDEICADEDTQVTTFHLALLAVARVTLMLETHPELVHLDKVGEDERNRVLEVALGTVRGVSGKGVRRRAGLTRLRSRRAGSPWSDR